MTMTLNIPTVESSVISVYLADACEADHYSSVLNITYVQIVVVGATPCIYATVPICLGGKLMTKGKRYACIPFNK